MSLPIGNRGLGMRVLPPRPPMPSLWSRIKAWLTAIISNTGGYNGM